MAGDTRWQGYRVEATSAQADAKGRPALAGVPDKEKGKAAFP